MWLDYIFMKNIIDVVRLILYNFNFHKLNFVILEKIILFLNSLINNMVISKIKKKIKRRR